MPDKMLVPLFRMPHGIVFDISILPVVDAILALNLVGKRCEVEHVVADPVSLTHRLNGLALRFQDADGAKGSWKDARWNLTVVTRIKFEQEEYWIWFQQLENLGTCTCWSA